MFAGLLLLVAAAEATPPQVSFEFKGQPECVSLRYEDGVTHVTNGCEHPLLVDQSVGGIILAQASAEVRDLSAFTVGLDGQLYRVIATVAEPELRDESATAISQR